MPEQILDPSTFRRTAWKNGQGRTTEIAAEREPGCADFDFTWRVSLAEIRASGPFSRFPDTGRLIMQLDGPQLVLTHPGTTQPAVHLQPFEPYSFAGDWDTVAQLDQPRGVKDCVPAHDFNLMLRRNRALGALAAFSPEDLAAGDCLKRLATAAGAGDNRVLLYAHAGSFEIGAQHVPAGSAYFWSGTGIPAIPSIRASASARIIAALIALPLRAV